jgi:hypothetical protein
MGGTPAEGVCMRLSTLLKHRSVLAALLLTGFGSAPVRAQDATYVVVITGLSGEPRFVDSFKQWGGQIVDAAKNRFGVPVANIIYLSEDPTRDSARMTGKATRETVEQAFRTIGAKASPGDQVLIVLMGHGSQAGDIAKFSLPGPDLTAVDFGRILEPLRAQRVAFVNTASASGAFLEPLAGRNRAIVTATRSGTEQNETIFPRYFAAALSGDGADTDKDGRISMFEAFDFARREVLREYGQRNLLVTEHALLDDNGDGTGISEPAPNAKDGAFARSFALSAISSATAAAAAANPAIRALVEQRRALEARVDALRARKEQMDSTAYAADLQKLLIELATKSREIRQLQERRP